MMHPMTSPAPTVSVIVPAFHEAPNLAPLARRLFHALHDAGMTGELIIVDDDSNDETAEVVTQLATRFPVQLIVRKGERGLSSAVLRGFANARADRWVVMDADLQHPPEKIPELLTRLDQPPCDFVLASRYIPGADVEDRWPLHRRLISRLATLLARPIAPLSDPMSGFFALRRETFARAEQLNPLGYKIALELYVKCRCRHPAEVPIRFAARHAGQSKLTLREQGRFLRHLVRLYRFRFPGPARFALLLALLLLGTLLILASAGFAPHPMPPCSS